MILSKCCDAEVKFGMVDDKVGHGEMALSGEWDCTKMEGRETGFEAQIYLIDNLLNKIQHG
jgi:hypothetical protein